MLSQFKVKPKILTFTETWLTVDNVDFIELPGYKLYSLERLNRKGGVCAFVDSTFNVTPVQCQLFFYFGMFSNIN